MMTALAVLLTAALDVWSVSPSVTKAAEAGIPGWLDQVPPSVVSGDARRDVHLGAGFPVFSLDDRDVPAFLTDLNPRRNIHNWQVVYPVLDRDEQEIGWIGVMVFDDSRGPKAGTFSWGRGRLVFVTQVNETKKMSDVARILGLVNPGNCGPEMWVIYVDKSGKTAKKAFSTAFDRARSTDKIVIGTVSDIRERALTITESPDSSSSSTKFFDIATLTVDRVLKGSAWTGKMRIFFPSHEPRIACAPEVRSGDHRIWYLDSQYSMLLQRLMLSESQCVVSLKYLDQVEKEIAEDAARPASK